MELATIEQTVKADLAALLNVSVDQISMVEAVERTWPDRGLGCNTRRGMYEPTPVPGYLVKLTHAGQTFEYHTDQHGNFVRCREPGKRLGPIMR